MTFPLLRLPGYKVPERRQIVLGSAEIVAIVRVIVLAAYFAAPSHLESPAWLHMVTSHEQVRVMTRGELTQVDIISPS